MQDDPGDMQEHHEKKKHHPQHGRCRPRQKFDKDTDGRGKERHTHKVRPEQPSRHPRRHQSGHESTIQKVLNPENNQGNGHKDSYKRLARFPGGEDWYGVHAVAATPSSLQELDPFAALHLYPIPAFLAKTALGSHVSAGPSRSWMLLGNRRRAASAGWPHRPAFGLRQLTIVPGFVSGGRGPVLPKWS